jgi:hypothetical protein
VAAILTSPAPQSQWFLETFTERKMLVLELGDSEIKYNRRAEGGW